MEQQTSKTWIELIIGIIVIAIIGGVWLWYHNPSPAYPDPETPAPTPQSDTLSDGTITFAYSPKLFGLATNPAQILLKSYIPACSEPFNYCLYYHDQTYKGTNFESAGLRIQKRTDLPTETACLETPPEGYGVSFKPVATEQGDNYKTSAFWPLGDAGAGHVANGELYRLSYTGTAPGTNTSTAIRAVSCYEFETRIGMTQFGNYPAGSIREFTSTDKITVRSVLRSILEHTTLPNDTRLIFPNPADRTR